MNKKVLILSSSPRKGGNSETLAAAFAKGAQEAGNQVELVHLREKQYGFCKGCFACLKLGHCVIKDDAVEIVSQMHDADVLVFATPVYYYSVSGQLKTMLDRANPLFDTDYYKTPRGYHPRSLNSNGGWNVTSSLSFLNMPILQYSSEIRSAVLLVHGEKAHSRYFSETAYSKLTGDNKELLIIPGASHTDLYDQMDVIPFEKLKVFFDAYLK